MRRCSEFREARRVRAIGCLALALIPWAPGTASPAASAAACTGTLYLTFDTGSMRHAEAIAGILARHGVRATFFLANERTPRGDHALDEAWGAYWRARAAEGHAFGSHTFDHVYLRPAARDGGAPIAAKPQFGPDAGRTLRWDGDALCAELRRVDARLRTLAGRGLDPIWRAPGGRAPDAAVDAARGCGYAHVHWAPAGFLGDELPSETHPNARLLERALRDLRDGDIVMAHLGIWSRRDPFAPMLDPLIDGLRKRGFCFATIPEHPSHARR